MALHSQTYVCHAFSGISFFPHFNAQIFLFCYCTYHHHHVVPAVLFLPSGPSLSPPFIQFHISFSFSMFTVIDTFKLFLFFPSSNSFIAIPFFFIVLILCGLLFSHFWFISFYFHMHLADSLVFSAKYSFLVSSLLFGLRFLSYCLAYNTIVISFFLSTTSFSLYLLLQFLPVFFFTCFHRFFLFCLPSSLMSNI